MSQRLERLRRRAASYLEAGQSTAAAAALEALLAEDPHDDRTRLDLSLARLHADRYRDAHTDALRACEHDLADPALALARLEALRSFAEHDRMAEVAAQVVALDRLGVRELTHAASTLAVCAEGEQAMRWVEAALRQDPDDLLARVNRALIAFDLGDIDTAESDLEAVCADARLVPYAHWLLAMLRRWSVQSSHVERLRRLLALDGLAPIERAQLGFALHKELDDLGRHEEAWEALVPACRAKRSIVEHDEAQETALAMALQARFADAMLESNEAPTATAPTPIFIVGMHRSGTSLLERILEAHPQVAAGGESLRLTAQLNWATDHHCVRVLDQTLLERADRVDHVELGQRYLQAHRRLVAGRTHFTEKQPGNYLLLGFIRRALPGARVLHLVRDPVDTCWSNLRELFSGNSAAHSYDPIELARHFARYRGVMQHWRRVLPDFVLDVRYDDLVRDPESMVRCILAFCGLDWVPGCIRIEDRAGPVRTASAAQVREPIHGRSLRRWAPYAQHLQPLHAELLRLHMLDENSS